MGKWLQWTNILPYCTFVSRSAAKLDIECERGMVGRIEDVMPRNILDTKSRAFPFCSMNKLHMFQGLTDISNVKRKDQLILSKLNWLCSLMSSNYFKDTQNQWSFFKSLYLSLYYSFDNSCINNDVHIKLSWQNSQHFYLSGQKYMYVPYSR